MSDARDRRVERWAVGPSLDAGRSLLESVLRSERGHRIALATVLLLVGLREAWQAGAALAVWDWLLISGLAALTAGVLLAGDLRRRMEEMLVRLADRGVLEANADSLSLLCAALEDRALGWARWSVPVVVVSLLVATVVAYGPDGVVEEKLPLALLEAALGLVAAGYLGRMVLYGRLGGLLRRRGVAVRVQPGHPDQVAGLKPVGEFYAFQAALTAIPAVFLAAWWFVIPAWAPHYEHWRAPYLGLLPVAIAFEVGAFLIPLWSFHDRMAAQKARLRREADALSRRIAALQAELVNAEDEPKRGVIKDRLRSMTERYWALERMPTWPLDLGMWHRYVVGNLALASPLLTEVLGLAGIWHALLEVVKNAGAGGA